nr:PAS domain S-box protein [Komagataeibacter kakiaceti]
MRELTALTADILLPALQQAIDAIVIFDERNEIVFYNAAAEALWGRPRAEVMGRDVACLIPLCIRHEHARNASRAAGGELNQMLDTTREIAFSRADGEYVCGELSLSRVRMGDGGQVYYVGVVRNITEETRRARILNLQAEVIQALTGDMPLDDIGHLICRKVESFLPDSIATLMFVEEEHTHWRVISTPALPPRIRDALESTVPTGPTGKRSSPPHPMPGGWRGITASPSAARWGCARAMQRRCRRRTGRLSGFSRSTCVRATASAHGRSDWWGRVRRSARWRWSDRPPARRSRSSRAMIH